MLAPKLGESLKFAEKTKQTRERGEGGLRQGSLKKTEWTRLVGEEDGLGSRLRRQNWTWKRVSQKFVRPMT